jgi:hypothetical protein
VRRFVVFPFQSLDKAFLAGTQAPWASFAPVWRLEYRGVLSEEQLVRALGWVLARYPWGSARVLDEAWVLAEKIDASRQFSVLDLRGAPDLQKEAALADRFLALETEAPLALTWIRRTDAAGVLVFQQHHSLADGRAFLGLVADFVRCLDATTSPLASGVVPRRKERETADRGLGAFLRGALHTIAELLLGNLRPLTPLFSNTGVDYSGSNRTQHLFVPTGRIEAWRAQRVKLGLSVNDLLAGALCVALARWSQALGARPGEHNLLMPIDVRPREGFESFANHLSTIQLRWRAEAGPIALAQRLQRAAAPVLAARLPWKRIVFDAFLILATPMAVLRRTLLVKRQLLTNYSFSNLVPLGTPGAGPDGRWRSSTMVIERLLITTPCTPPQAANTTVVRYGDEVCFNFNFKDSALTAVQVEQLTKEFSAALDELEQDLCRGSG